MCRQPHNSWTEQQATRYSMFLLMTSHSLTLTSFETHITFFLLWKTNQEIEPNESRLRQTLSWMKTHHKHNPYDYMSYIPIPLRSYTSFAWEIDANLNCNLFVSFFCTGMLESMYLYGLLWWWFITLYYNSRKFCIIGLIFNHLLIAFTF